MARNRVFTQEELKEMGTSPKDAAIEALRAGEKEKAEKFIREFAAAAEAMHDNYVRCTAEFLDYLYVHYGEEVLYQAMREIFRDATEKLIAAFGKEDFRKQIQMLAFTLHGHLHGPLDIEEDDEKVSIKMMPCGAGQWLVESGAYECPRKLSRLKAHPMTWGIADFPIYCAHAPVLEILAIEKQGRPCYMNFPAAEMASESCRFVIYKDPKHIPDEVYTRVGMDRSQ